MPAPRPPKPPAPPTNIVFLLRFLVPGALLLASVFAFNLQTIPYFAAFLLLHLRPAYSISLSCYPAIFLLSLLAYSVAAALTHLILTLLITFDVLLPASLSAESALSLGLPRYDVSAWQGLRVLIPHLAALVPALLVLLVRIPPGHRYAGSRFIFAWFRRRKRHRARAAARRAPPPAVPGTTPTNAPPHHRSPLAQPSLRDRAFTVMYQRPRKGDRPLPAAADKPLETDPSPDFAESNLTEQHDFGSVITDEDDIHLPFARQKRSRSRGRPQMTKFIAFMAGHGGLFWCALSTAAVAVSFSSLCTFIFLAMYSAVVISWAFHIKLLHPTENSSHCLTVLMVFRSYVMLYLMVLVIFQLPWLRPWATPQYEGSTVHSVLRFVGLVAIDTTLPDGWTAVMAFGAAVATYLFTGMLQGALTSIQRIKQCNEAHPPDSEAAVTPTIDEEVRAALDGEDDRKLSYYERQFQLLVMHASSLGLLVWALVFPGVCTLPFLVAALIYLGLKSSRRSRLFDYIIPYAVVLQMSHYLLIAIVNAFETSIDTESPVLQLLGLQSLNLQFSVNLIESIAIGLLCVNVSSKRHMDDAESDVTHTPESGLARSMEIHEFVRRSLYTSISRKRDSLYSPLKLCVDQLALASLYIAGGLDVTALNAVFLVALSTICLLQSFGLFRRPRIFATAWGVLLIYSILFLLTTGTVCRAIDAKWQCGLEFEGFKKANRGQVVAYAATVVLASIQVTFTWSYRSVEEADYMKDFEGAFWRVLRRYFLYAAYAALLLYPLLFPANFLSYGYVLFLFLSIAVELLIPSLKGDKADVRRLVKKYWILVVVFALAAMLSRYFVRLQWFDSKSNIQRWFFGLETDDTRKFVVTVGDAVVLIIMSLQSRLFVVDSIVETEKSKHGPFTGISGAVSGDSHEHHETWSDPGDVAVAFKDRAIEVPLPKHRRYKSMEEYLDNEFLPNEMDLVESSLTASRRSSQIIGRRLSHTLPVASPGSEALPSDRSISPEARRAQQEAEADVEAEQLKEELQQILDRARIEQAVDMFRNFRKSVPVKQTEKFLLDAYAQALLLLRSGMLQYCYVLEATAVLAAAVWLPGLSVFGAIYIVLGCILLLTEVPLLKRRSDRTAEIPSHSVATALPAVLIILSFSLMSAQYIFLIVHLISESADGSVSAYIGLQSPDDDGELPLEVQAIIAHVIVFISAIVQRVAMRWARMDAELLLEDERDVSEYGGGVVDSLPSRSALDSAIPIASVVEGVGGGTNDLSDTLPRRSASKAYPVDWSEMSTWKTTRFEIPSMGSVDKSSDSRRLDSSEHLSSDKSSEQDVIERLRWRISGFLKSLSSHFAAVLSLLSPFWKDWGFDVTFMYLVICGVVTRTVFSVIYVAIVLVLGRLKRRKVQNHWHQISLLLVVLVVAQYFLTLGLPGGTNTDAQAQAGTIVSWRRWLLLDQDNDSRERKLAITFAFIAVICSGITLNSVSHGSRSLSYWLTQLQSESGSIQDVGSDGAVHHILDAREGENSESGIASPPNRLLLENQAQGLHYSDDIHHSAGQRLDEPGQPTLGHFISGLGHRRASRTEHFDDTIGLRPHTRLESRDEQDTEQNPPATSLSSQEISRNSLNRNSSRSTSRRRSTSETSSNEVEKQVFRPSDPRDFTRRPISFKNWVKLTWMRFAGPLVQLYVFAVASVDTNVISAILLMMAFSFLFQFTNVSAKKSRFGVVRFYVIGVIFALVVYQAPFEVSDEEWEEVVGLFKKDTVRGNDYINLMVSLWFFSQVLCRVYESKDFYYVEKYGQEDAKVRFKRAVHEHNSRKYEKMLDRNKAERSHYARRSRLTRLKALKESEKTVDAFYNVCVAQEMEIIRKQAEAAKSSPKAPSPFRLVEDAENEEGLPTGLASILRKLLRGKRWKQYASQTLSSEAKAFVFRYSSWPVYGTMVLAAVMNPSITTIAYPISVFLYLIVEQPRPPKHAWTALMVYVCAIIALKYIFRSPQIEFCGMGVPFFALDSSDPSVRNLDDCAFAAGIGFDIFVLLALLGHRAVLYSRGFWDLVKSEEDMLLRSEIKGKEVETEADMRYEAGSTSEALADIVSVTGNDHTLLSSSNRQEHYWSAQQQCDDVEHILHEARTEIAMGYTERQEALKKASRRSGLVPAASHRFQIQAPLPPGPSSPQTQPVPQLFSGRSAGITVTNRRPAPHRDGVREERIPGIEEEFYSSRHASTTRGTVGMVPQSAPPPGSRLRSSDTPSVQGSDRARHVHLSRFRSFRPGVNKPAHPVASPVQMTAGQSRVQESLIQGKIIPQAPYGRAQGSLELFNVERKGVVSFLRQYFLRLTKENDHKSVGDYYLLIFIVDFISFVYVMFGFSAIFGDDSGERQQTWWTTNFIETRHLVTLFVMFIAIILDRICYLTRSMTGKLILQYSSVIVYHTFLFIVQDNIGTRAATRIFYVLRCIYFLLSGLQIRNGFPMYTTAQFLLRNYTTPGIVLFEIYIFVPFLWLTRTLLDWAVLPTSLEIFQYFRFIDIYLWLYRNRAVNMSRGSFQRKLGEKRRVLPRVYQGFGLFLLCVIALFAPFIIFSIFNPFFLGRELRDATVTVDLLTHELGGAVDRAGATAYPIFSRTSVVGNALDRAESLDAAQDIGVSLDVREKEKVFEAWFSTISDSLWQPAEEDKTQLITSLRQYADGEQLSPPELAFSLHATTNRRDTFGTEVQELPLNRSQATAIATAIANEENLALKVLSPLPRYSILQSSASVFQSYPPNASRREVCIRLIQNGPSFWVVSNCIEGCVCSKNASVNGPNAEIRHILQVADVSTLQVGGATILTLYTAILFTIANLLKRMFIDKRLIIPYIDMPYTLHLYQLVLDIMYARQDNQLEMEEILYNGLIDIYRDQHELAKWAGERALKLPAKWWEKSEDVSDPFLVYPSFLETPTEPYVDRKVE